MSKQTIQQSHKGYIPYTEAEQNRLFQHLMQIENNFNNRLNTFIVLETILFGVIGLLYQKQPVNAFIVFLLIGLGLSMTLIWGYAQARQRFVYKNLKERCRR